MKIMDFQKIKDNIIIFPQTGGMFEVTDSALKALELIKYGKNFDEIIDILSQQYPNINRKQLYKDLESFIRLLKINGLVTGDN